MLLRASAEKNGEDVNVASVTNPEQLSNIPNGDVLIDLTDALLERESERLAHARERAVREIGAARTVDALAIASAFNGITRVADATGIELDETTEAMTIDLRADLGIDEFHQSRKASRFA